MDRRDFIKICGLMVGVTSVAGFWWLRSDNSVNGYRKEDNMVEARYYEQLDDNNVRCNLCFRNCYIEEGRRGVCRNRENNDGELYNIVYSLPAAVNVDPIEKEPMHHFLPDTQILCIGTAGCNFRCKFCHNWRMSQRSLEEVRDVQNLTPEDIVEAAKNRGIPSISFTYNEPTVFYEYMYDTAKLAQENGLNVIFHSNGAMNQEPLEDLLQHIDGVTVDLKAFTDDFYNDICEARLDPVLSTLKTIYQSGAWLEIVNLVLPEKNDSPEEIREMSRWINNELGNEVPVHFNRFSPAYQMTDLMPTPIETLERCRDIAKSEGIKYITIGNAPGHIYNSSFCPECNSVIIDRTHFSIHEVNMENGKCGECGAEIPGVWHD